MTDMEKELVDFLMLAYSVNTDNIVEIRAAAERLIEKYEDKMKEP